MKNNSLELIIDEMKKNCKSIDCDNCIANVKNDSCLLDDLLDIINEINSLINRE